MRRRLTTDTLLIGAGIIAGTVVSVILMSSGWLVLAGPGAMGLAMLAVTLVNRRRYGPAHGSFARFFWLAGSLMLASALVAFADPRHVATMMPILSAAIAAPFLAVRGGTDDRECARHPWV